jgi:hypothetical protein
MKTIETILQNLSTNCDPITLDCNSTVARETWLRVTSFREQMYLELCVEPLTDNTCVVYVEYWGDVEETKATPYVLIILTCFVLGAIICLK